MPPSPRLPPLEARGRKSPFFFFVLSLLNIVDAFGLNVVWPMLPFMVESYGVASSEKDLGAWVGFAGAATSVGQLLSSYPWGVAADRFGRRPVMLLGMFLSTFSVLVFGTAGSYAQCVSGRFLTGLLNGNAGVVKTYIGETTDKTQQARAFSIFAMAFGVASCVAPAVGGFLQRPAERWPDTFEGTVFERYPFLLPMLFAGMLTLTGGVLGFLYVPESASQWRRMEAKASGGDAAYYARVGDDDDDDDDDEGERPYEGKDRSEALLTIVDDDGERGLKEVEMGVVKTMSGEDGTSIDAADVELGGTAAAETKKPKDDSAAAAAAAAKGLSTRGWNAHTVEAIASYAALAAIAIGYDEIFPVYAKTSTSLGGLELSAGEIGAVLVFGGVTLVTFQLFLFPRVLKALGVTGGLRFGAVAFACVALIAPTAAMVDEDDVVARWVVLLLSQALKICTLALLFTTIIMAVNNSCVNAFKARVNGVATSVAALGRIIAPVACGVVYSWSLRMGERGQQYVVFGFVAACAAGLRALVGRLPRALDDAPREVDDAEEEEDEEGDE